MTPTPPLAPCRFCRAAPTEYQTGDGQGWVECVKQGCPIRGIHISMEWWNNRTPSSAERDLLARKLEIAYDSLSQLAKGNRAPGVLEIARRALAAIRGEF